MILVFFWIQCYCIFATIMHLKTHYCTTVSNSNYRFLYLNKTEIPLDPQMFRLIDQICNAYSEGLTDRWLLWTDVYTNTLFEITKYNSANLWSSIVADNSNVGGLCHFILKYGYDSTFIICVYNFLSPILFIINIYYTIFLNKYII